MKSKIIILFTLLTCIPLATADVCANKMKQKKKKLHYTYLTNTIAQTIPLSSTITFNSVNNMSNGFTHQQGSGSIKVLNAGIYAISFLVNSVKPNRCALFVNGVLVPNSFYSSSDNQNQGQVILSLCDNDVITLRNYLCPTGIILPMATHGATLPVNASLIIQQISS